MRSNRIHIPADDRKAEKGWLGIGIMCCIPPISWLGILLGIRKIFAIRKNRMHRVFREYEELCYGRDCIDFSELSDMTGRPIQMIERHLMEMEARHYIDDGVIIDRARKRIVLEPSMFRGENRTARPQPVEIHWADRGQPATPVAPPTVTPAQPVATATPEPMPEEKPAKKPARPAKRDSTDTLEEMLVEIRDVNERIADKEVSARIDRIGELTASISAVVREKPSAADEVRKFLSYYLPTTLKLLKSYALMEKQSSQGENIVESRKKIEDILDTLVRAFEEQQDKLFSTDALDVDAEIQVLEAMMASDGLIKPAGGTELHATARGNH